MRHGNFRWMKIGLCALGTLSGSLMLQACVKTGAEFEAANDLMFTSIQRGIKTHVDEEKKARDRNRANANFLRDVFGDPDKKKRRKTNCLVIRKLELEPVYGIYGTGGAGGAGGAGGGGPNC